ncbi:hypothetical protein PG994_008190 [Apiospora phragmitis]|uniref:Uncharacterized protein n=1 Tax=Apiospora phragmitis TaxID=2905665 RepID=A0ABR1USC3_9PEZI
MSEILPDCDHDTHGQKRQSNGVSICSIANDVVASNINLIQDDDDKKKTFVNNTVYQLTETYTEYNALVYSDEESGDNKKSEFQHQRGGYAEGKNFNLPLLEGRYHRYHIWVFTTGTFSPGGDHRVSGVRGGGEWGGGPCIEQNSRGNDVVFCNRASEQQPPGTGTGTKTRKTAKTTASSSSATQQLSTATATASVVSTTSELPSPGASSHEPTTATVQTPSSTAGVSPAVARPTTAAAAAACVAGLVFLCL